MSALAALIVTMLGAGLFTLIGVVLAVAISARRSGTPPAGQYATPIVNETA